MSKRTEVRAKRQQQTQFQTIFVIILAVVAVVAVGYLVYQGFQSGGVGVSATSSYDPNKAVGPATAKVVVQEFADFQCPFCGRFATGPVRELIDQYAQAGKVRFEYHHFIVVDGNVGGSESLHAAEASECAGDQGKFWNMYTYLFSHQKGEGEGTFSDANLKSMAAAVGLDTAKFNACFDAQTYAAKVEQDNALARSLGINQTPTLFINRQAITNPQDVNQVKSMLDTAIAQNP